MEYRRRLGVPESAVPGRDQRALRAAGGGHWPLRRKDEGRAEGSGAVNRGNGVGEPPRNPFARPAMRPLEQQAPLPGLPPLQHVPRPKPRETGLNTVHATLKTVWGEHLHNHTRFMPHPKYPRPGLVRKSAGAVWWESLNGYWDYSVTAKDEATGPAGARSLGWAGKIRVPFPFESQLGGVVGDRVLEPSQFLWYRRTFRLSDSVLGGKGERHGDRDGSAQPATQLADRAASTASTTALRYYINFEAVDYACEVWVNDVAVGGHRGGNTPFRLDVSDAVAAAEVPGARNDLLAHEVQALHTKHRENTVQIPNAVHTQRKCAAGSERTWCVHAVAFTRQSLPPWPML